MIRRKSRTIGNLISIYEHHRDVYYKRREEVRKRHKEELYILNRKLKAYKKELRKLNKRRNRLNRLKLAVKEFTGIKELTRMCRGNEKKIPKYLLYKFGLENGFSGKDLREITKAKRESEPSEYRKQFQASFDIIPSNKAIWYRFNYYIKTNFNELTRKA